MTYDEEMDAAQLWVDTNGPPDLDTARITADGADPFDLPPDPRSDEINARIEADGPDPWGYARALYVLQETPIVDFPAVCRFVGRAFLRAPEQVRDDACNLEVIYGG
jgi:hypothetical protein